jgi:hypothetical protein
MIDRGVVRIRGGNLGDDHGISHGPVLAMAAQVLPRPALEAIT